MKSEILCEGWLWQRCLTWWAGAAPKPAWLPLRWALQPLLSTWDTWKGSPSTYAIPGSSRWGGLWHCRLFPSGTLWPVQSLELSSVLRFSSLLQKTPYKLYFRLLKGSAVETCIATKGFITQIFDAEEGCIFHQGSKGATPKTFYHVFFDLPRWKPQLLWSTSEH